MTLWFGSIFSDLAAPVIVYWCKSNSSCLAICLQRRRKLISLSPENAIDPALEPEGSNKQAEGNVIFLLSVA